MITIKIYTLTNPLNGKVFYVGQTIDLEKRLNSHISLKNKETNNKAAIIRYLLLNGYEPIMEEIDSINCIYREDEDYANEIEMYWVHQFKQWGFNLVNSIGIDICRKEPRKYSRILKESAFEILLSIKNNKKKQFKDIRDEFTSADNLSHEEKIELLNAYDLAWDRWSKRFYNFVYSLPTNDSYPLYIKSSSEEM